MEPDEIDILALAVPGDFKQIIDIQKTGFAG